MRVQPEKCLLGILRYLLKSLALGTATPRPPLAVALSLLEDEVQPGAGQTQRRNQARPGTCSAASPVPRRATPIGAEAADLRPLLVPAHAACALEPGSSGAPSQRPVLRETTSTHRRPVPAKALAPMEETEPGRESDESDEQSLNALAPMLVTEAGIATDRRAVQPRRAPLPMLVSEPGRTIDSSVVQR